VKKLRCHPPWRNVDVSESRRSTLLSLSLGCLRMFVNSARIYKNGGPVRYKYGALVLTSLLCHFLLFSDAVLLYARNPLAVKFCRILNSDSTRTKLGTAFRTGTGNVLCVLARLKYRKYVMQENVQNQKEYLSQNVAAPRLLQALFSQTV